MKRIILGLLTIVYCFNAAAQKNNPHDGFGKDYFESVSKVVEDISANGFKGVDQKSLDYYASITTVEAGIKPEVANAVYEASNAKEFRPAEIIRGSKYSEEWQELSIKLISDLGTMNVDERAGYFDNIIEAINRSRMSSSERELILKLTSIVHQAYLNHDQTGSAFGNRDMARRWDCGYEGPDGHVSTHPAACVGTAAVVGAAIGGSFCGVPCAVGGAIVFAVVTAILVC